MSTSFEQTLDTLADEYSLMSISDENIGLEQNNNNNNEHEIEDLPTRQQLINEHPVLRTNANVLKYLEIYSKVKLTRVNSHLFSTEGYQDSFRKYNISGVTYDFYFEVEFDVNEHELCIINLKVKVNPSCRREIGDFIESVELARNLHAFFKGFIEYARLNHQRTLLFNALREKYSRLTNSLQRNYLKSKDTKANFVGTNSILKFSDNCQKISPELILLWNLNITPSGHVQPDVQLFAQMPSKWRKLDEYQLIDQIPHIFHKLVELKGVQIAVEISIQSIFGIEI